MGDYSPLHRPGQTITRETSAAVTGGQLLVVGGAGTVAPTSASTAAWLGVAAFDAASGADVGVESGGVQRLTAGGVVAVGAMLVAGAAGKVVASATPADGHLVGIALTAAAADGDIIEAKLAR